MHVVIVLYSPFSINTELIPNFDNDCLVALLGKKALEYRFILDLMMMSITIQYDTNMYHILDKQN